MKAFNQAKDALIDHTIEAWEPRLDRKVSREDARQIIENLTGFFSVLAEWALAETAEPPTNVLKPGET